MEGREGEREGGRGKGVNYIAVVVFQFDDGFDGRPQDRGEGREENAPREEGASEGGCEQEVCEWSTEEVGGVSEGVEKQRSGSSRGRV